MLDTGGPGGAVTFGSQDELMWHLPSRLPLPPVRRAGQQEVELLDEGQEVLYKKVTANQACAIILTTVKAISKSMSSVSSRTRESESVAFDVVLVENS